MIPVRPFRKTCLTGTTAFLLAACNFNPSPDAPLEAAKAYEDFSPSWSPDGSTLVYSSDRDGNRNIYSLDLASGTERALTHGTLQEWAPAWSPDGRRIAYCADLDDNEDIYVMDADGSNTVRLTNHPAKDCTPGWTPDGERILFMSARNGNWQQFAEDNYELFLMNADGTELTQLTDNPGYDLATGQAFSPDGEYIVFCSTMDRKFVRNSDRFDDFDLYIMKSDGSGLRRLTTTPGQDSYAFWSPDGEWISYTHVEKDAALEPTTGGENYEIFIVRPDGNGMTQLTDNANYDFEGWWSPDSRRIAYSSSRELPMAIYVMDADGGNKRRLTNHD